MKYHIAAIVYLVAFLLQTNILGHLTIFDSSANLILCCAAAISFIYSDNSAGLVLGAVFSCIYDMAFCQYIGITAIPVVITAAVCILVREVFLNRENVMSMVVVSAGSVWVYYHIYFIMLEISGAACSYPFMFQKLLIYTVLNVIVMMIMYFFMIENATRQRNKGQMKWAGF